MNNHYYYYSYNSEICVVPSLKSFCIPSTCELMFVGNQLLLIIRHTDSVVFLEEFADDIGEEFCSTICR